MKTIEGKLLKSIVHSNGDRIVTDHQFDTEATAVIELNYGDIYIGDTVLIKALVIGKSDDSGYIYVRFGANIGRCPPIAIVHTIPAPKPQLTEDKKLRNELTEKLKQLDEIIARKREETK